jgi:acetyltransferase-like isoleucine patch superfamily enzyme
MENPFDVGYYYTPELRRMGFGSIGENVRIARNCNIVGLANINIGHDVQIDSFCQIIATGPVRLGSYIHIGAFCLLSGKAGITMDDLSGLSQGVRIYSASDDYSGRTLAGPMVPAEFKNVKLAHVRLARHVIVGSGAVILPGACMGEGVALGALSLATHRLMPWGIYSGTPAKFIRERRRDLLALEARFLATEFVQAA